MIVDEAKITEQVNHTTARVLSSLLQELSRITGQDVQGAVVLRRAGYIDTIRCVSYDPVDAARDLFDADAGARPGDAVRLGHEFHVRPRTNPQEPT